MVQIWYILLYSLINLLTYSKQGKYEFSLADPNGLFSGSLVGTPSSWRTMQFTSGLSEVDCILLGTYPLTDSLTTHYYLLTRALGNGGGSVWNFEYEKGAFEIEFRCDAFNHFICNLYPAHSHWTCDGNVVSISWGKNY